MKENFPNLVEEIDLQVQEAQRGCQNKETKKHGPNERTDQNSRKRAKQDGDKQSIRCRVKTLVIRMLKEFNKDFNSMKKIQSETKDTLMK